MFKIPMERAMQHDNILLCVSPTWSSYVFYVQVLCIRLVSYVQMLVIMETLLIRILST